MNPFKGALWTVVVILLGVCIYGILMIRAGFSAREQPSFLETVIARTVRDAAIPPERGASTHRLPQPPSY